MPNESEGSQSGHTIEEIDRVHVVFNQTELNLSTHPTIHDPLLYSTERSNAGPAIHYFVALRASTAPPVMPALSPSLEATISMPLVVPSMA